MDKISRYLILVFFFIVFLGLAPLIILYVSGTNFTKSGSLSTGILDVQSNPNNAQIFLNGKESSTTPATIRFLPQGTYDIEVRKEGYRTWQKRLFVTANQVTYTGGNNDLIQLLPDTAPVKLNDDSATLAILSEQQVIYTTTNNSLKSFGLNNPQNIKTLLPVTKPISKLTPSNKIGFIFIEYQTGQKDLFDLNKNTLVNLPERFKSAEQVFINRDNIIFARIGDKLWTSPLNSKIGQLLLPKVLSINVIENNLYVARQNPDPLLTVYLWNGQFLDAEQILVASQLDNQTTAAWPETNQFKLFVTARREIFAQANEKLFRVNQTIEQIADQVKWMQFNSVRGELIYRTPTGISFYNFLASDVAMLYRSSENILDALIKPELGYSFITSDSGIKAIETDTRDNQNLYTLSELVNIPELLITDNDQQLIFLNPSEQTIYSLMVKK